MTSEITRRNRVAPTGGTGKTATRRALEMLGLPFPSRWESAAPLLKLKIIEARKSGDELASREWSEVKAYLKSTLYRSCIVCGEACSRLANRCSLHREQQPPSKSPRCACGGVKHHLAMECFECRYPNICSCGRRMLGGSKKCLDCIRCPIKMASI